VLEEADEILKAEGMIVPFKLVLLGENFQAKPTSFITAGENYGDRILQYGFCKDKSEYFKWLSKSDIVVSTSIQENFGISIVEAAWAGCFPLLPDRLSYPELVPVEYKDQILYSDRIDFLNKLLKLLREISENPLKTFSEHYENYSWKQMAPVYDDHFFNIIK
jgi:glycosyltransferase involved in cell wall biosynthesis